MNSRKFTLEALLRIARPVLEALSQGQLKARMPVETIAGSNRRDCSHLEALGRLLAGMAPWLELGPDATEEGKLRAHYADLSLKAITHAVDPQSADCLNFNRGSQPLVDAAFLAHGLLRAPTQIRSRLDEETRERVMSSLVSTRIIKPGQNNWLLFSAMVEAALWRWTGTCEILPIETAIQQHLAWYAGDGAYGDGPDYHWDYYNSFVIHPMLIEITRVCRDELHPLGAHLPLFMERARRYAEVQERLISPEGTFPIMGRSSCYRFGAFQLLSQMALERQLPPELEPSAVRTALTAVISRMMEAPGTFDAEGWLRLGVVGHQPSQAEGYISTGSLYLCTLGLLHLGLPADDPFWTEEDRPWTQKRIWSGEDLPADHALAH